MLRAVLGSKNTKCVSYLYLPYKKLRTLLMGIMLCHFVINGSAFAATQVIFTAPSRTLAKAIFPSNVFTDPAPANATGVQVHLDSDANNCLSGGQAVCGYAGYLNRLDGFSVNPRISFCFTKNDVDWNTVQSGISFINLDRPAAPIGINQVVVDTVGSCVYAKPDRVLNQKTRYLLTIRNTVRTPSGAVERAEEFTNCLNSSQDYCSKLSVAVNAQQLPASIAGASVFTTMDVTGWLEGAYRYIDRTQPPMVLPAGFPWVFPVKNIRSMTWNADKSGLQPQTIPLTPALDNVGSVAFGLYASPNYINTSGPDIGSITTSPDRPAAIPQLMGGLTFGYVPVSFHVFLPKTAPPPGGYPVVIYGHGLSDSQFGAPTYIASTLAKSGYATLAMEIQGHGYGQNSTVTVKDKFGLSYTMLTPGRGVPLSGGTIGSTDGCIAPGPLAVRDCSRQTAADLFALIKTIQRTNGLALGLNPNAISYVGQSFGSIYGTLLHAVAPEVSTAVMNAGGGPFVDVARLAINGRPLGVQYLCGLGLLNVYPTSPQFPPSAACLQNGYQTMAAAQQNYFHDAFNDSYPYRDQPPVTTPEPGALNIQAAFEAAEWTGMLGDALSFAPHLKTSLLPGVPAKKTLLQQSVGDLEVPNPTNTALARAAGAENSTITFDFSQTPELFAIFDPYVPFPILPHRILSNPTIFNSANQKAVAMAEQKTVADFFSSGGNTVPNSNEYLNTAGSPYAGRTLFFPTADVPPGLNFIQIRP